MSVHFSAICSLSKVFFAALVIKPALASKPRYYPWGCIAPSRTSLKYTNIADASFLNWAGAKGQIAGNTKHDWCYNDGYPTTAPVGSFPDGASSFGVLDMNGNVGEWCLDEGESGSTSHVNRGGTWGGASMYDSSFENGEDTHFISTWLKVADPGADDRTGFRVACTCDTNSGSGACATETKVRNDMVELIKIPSGSFTAGTALDAEVPKDGISTVTISDAFYIGKYEVTKGEFRAFVTDASYTPDMSKGDAIVGDACFVKEAGSNSWAADKTKTWDTGIPMQTDSHPVSCVTWNDAKKFTDWLSDNNGKGWDCTLPTAAQWGYAARGTSDPCSGDNPDNYDSMDTSSECTTTGGSGASKSDDAASEDDKKATKAPAASTSGASGRSPGPYSYWQWQTLVGASVAVAWINALYGWEAVGSM